MEILKIGTQVYAVHKSYPDEKRINGKVYVARVKSYENVNGEVLPILKEVGSSKIISLSTHYMYMELRLAIEAIDVNNTLNPKLKENEKNIKKKR